MNVSLSNSPNVFTIERHGGLTLVIASPALAYLDATFEPQLTELLLNALRDAPEPLIVFDLGPVDYFGSMFLAVLLRCWKHTTSRGGALVLCGVSSQVKDLLRVTSLDIIWPLYPDRHSAMDALLSD
jgi:anti-sigma B factor antagonist